MEKVISIRLLHDCIFVSLFLFMLYPRVAVSQSVPVFTFAITDLFDSLNTEKDYLGSVTVIIGSEYNGIWTKAIYDSIGINLPTPRLNS
jgi:hypothetical protein